MMYRWLGCLTFVFAALALPGTVGAQEAAAEPAPLKTRLGSFFRPYGFVQLDAAWDDSRMAFNPQLAAYVLSEDPDHPAGAPKNESAFTMYTRLARLGMGLEFGRVEALWDVDVSGVVELDFYGGGSDSRNLLRMRHAYLTMKWDSFELLAGQTSDLIAPRIASVNYDMVMWGAGNLGDRRPQLRGTGRFSFSDVNLTLAGMIGATGAVDTQDIDNNGVLDGVQSALPTLQTRAGLDFRYFEKGSPAGIGVWAHWAREEIDDFGIGGRDQNHFTSWAIGFDAYVPLWEDRLWIHGEAWMGQNLTDVRGGIFQGVTADGREIRAAGGWIEAGVKITDWWRATAGYAIDDPRSRHLPDTGRTRNKIAFAKFEWTFNPVYFAIEYLHWETEYKAFGAGRNNRVKMYVGYRF
jgi:hypothetical protein